MGTKRTLEITIIKVYFVYVSHFSYNTADFLIECQL